MSGFWIAGIGINAVCLVVLMMGVKNWRRSDGKSSAERRNDRGDAR